MFSSVTISHILKRKIRSYVFRRVPLSIKLRPERKGTVIWPSVRMFGGSMSSDCFGGFLNQITTGKKGTVVWPSVAMFGGLIPKARIVLAGLLLCYLAGSLIKLQITTPKKGIVVWPSVGMSTMNF